MDTKTTASNTREYSYERFKTENAKVINKVLNVVLWISTLLGPLVAAFVALGVFSSMSYLACLITTVLCVGLAVAHTVLIKKKASSTAARYILLIGIEVILVFARYANINVVILLFIPPLLSLLYCDRKLYYIISAVSYVGLLAGVALSAEHWSSFVPTETATEWFVDHAIGYSMEYALVFLAGLMISVLIIWHMGTTFSDKMIILHREQELYTDKLTGLWNKMYLQKAYVKYVIQQKKLCSLVIVDIDNFKDVKDNYGHAESDRALTRFAGAFENTMESIERAVLCRSGEDEFIAFLPGFDREDALQTVLTELKRRMHETFKDDEHLKPITMSIGAVIMKNEYDDYPELFSKADSAVLFVKKNGKNDFHIYQEGDPLAPKR